MSHSLPLWVSVSISSPPAATQIEMATKKNYWRPRGTRDGFSFLAGLFIALFFVVFVASTFFSRKEECPAPTASVAVRGGGSMESAAAEEEQCDWTSGGWVVDNSTRPLYLERECRFMSDQTACEKFGRKELGFQIWRWQPDGCDLPKFNATKLLEKLRGKRLVYIGDSLNRNQWVSMVCLLDSSLPSASLKAMETNGSLMSFKAKDYNASIEFYWSPLLVESNSDDPVLHRLPDRIVRTQSIENHARHWMGADIMVFNSYLWWRRAKMKVLWGSFEGEQGVYKEIDMLRSYEMALRTWSEWLEFHVDPGKTRVFFMSLSPTHQEAKQWGAASDVNCYNETEPITRDGHWERGSESDIEILRTVEAAINGLQRRGITIQMVNVTRLSEYRKDGHPSIYRKQWDPLTEDELENPSSYADCIHWCLPGVPDVWNELLYAYIFS